MNQMKDKNSQRKFVRISIIKTDEEIRSILIMAHLAMNAVSYSTYYN
jgi:hypothetical protein